MPCVIAHLGHRQYVNISSSIVWKRWTSSALIYCEVHSYSINHDSEQDNCYYTGACYYYVCFRNSPMPVVSSGRCAFLACTVPQQEVSKEDVSWKWWSSSIVWKRCTSSALIYDNSEQDKLLLSWRYSFVLLSSTQFHFLSAFTPGKNSPIYARRLQCWMYVPFWLVRCLAIRGK